MPTFSRQATCAERVVVEDHVQAGQAVRRSVLTRGGAAPAERLVARVDDRPVVSRLVTAEPLEEVGPLGKLEGRLRCAILASDLSGAGVDDARHLVRGQEELVLELSFEDVVPSLAADEKIHVAPVGIPLTVAVVDEHLDRAIRRPSRGGSRLRIPGDPQHRMPGRDMVEGAADFRKTDFQVVQVDVDAAAVGR